MIESANRSPNDSDIDWEYGACEPEEENFGVIVLFQPPLSKDYKPGGIIIMTTENP